MHSPEGVVTWGPAVPLLEDCLTCPRMSAGLALLPHPHTEVSAVQETHVLSGPGDSAGDPWLAACTPAHPPSDTARVTPSATRNFSQAMEWRQRTPLTPRQLRDPGGPSSARAVPPGCSHSARGTPAPQLSSGRAYPPDSQDPQQLAGPGEATRASQLGLQAGTWSEPLEVS